MNIDSNNYKQFTWFILILVAISALVTYLVSRLLEQYGIILPFYIQAPSISGIYALLFFLFNRYFWKYKIFKKLGIIIADDLNGNWKGIVKSSYDDMKSDIDAELIIEQSATNIKIYGTFNQSKSVSIHENFGRSEIDNGYS
jgi:hypothetical protein